MRLKYAFSFLFAIGLGLLSRASFVHFPSIIDVYLGDVLWGGMVYFLVATVFTHVVWKSRLSMAILFAYLIEFSQLLQYDWLERVRNFPGMRLVMGYGFSISDLICYSMGIFVAWAIDKWWISK